MDIEYLVNNSIISRKGIEAALGLPPDIQLTADGIISKLKIVKVVYGDSDSKLIYVANKLIENLCNHGATCLTEEEAYENGRLKSNVCMIVVGNDDCQGELAVENISDARTNIMLTVLPGKGSLPVTGVGDGIIKGKYNFFNTDEYMEIRPQQLRLFSWWMTNLAAVVQDNKVRLLSMNGCYPEYDLESDEFAVAAGTKLGAPVLPPETDNFVICNYPITEGQFNPVLQDLQDFVNKNVKLDVEQYADNAVEYIDHIKKKYHDVDQPYLTVASDMFLSGYLADKTGLWEMSEKYDNLPFRNRKHHFIGQAVTNSGMSDGFRAVQMPAPILPLIPASKLQSLLHNGTPDTFYHDGEFYLKLTFPNDIYYSHIPCDLLTLTIPSGHPKTIIDNPIHGNLILGVTTFYDRGGLRRKKVMMTPEGVTLPDTYSPSYDTEVINGHRLSNHLMGQIIRTFKPGWQLPYQMEQYGMAVSHHHGDILLEKLMPGFLSYGDDFASVSCSSLQGPIYEVYGKLNGVVQTINQNREINGARHREPHHGVNVDFILSVLLMMHYLVNDASYMGEKI